MGTLPALALASARQLYRDSLPRCDGDALTWPEQHRLSQSECADFGELLRQHRLAPGLTQDSLAELAGLSVHGIQKLESGATHPYRDTAERLIRALKLGAQDAAQFKIATRPVPRRLPQAPGTTSWDTEPHQSARVGCRGRRLAPGATTRSEKSCSELDAGRKKCQ